ncbi:hypothetical protein [Pseudoflavitalea rhizosphaerae]|uniref:hypothetical protein n=1 Tax=Pseudoflavitalea rhizosphaerae TaxID=1884793 RepID=UPI000F8C50FF|nr:hypothetical protein [Pseudoflavitalea rhizosphaerae]
MRKTVLICILLPLLAMKCYKKEGPNCHHKITFRNKSDFTVLVADVYKNGEGKCTLSFTEFKSGEDYDREVDNCWEHALPYEVYIISPEKFHRGGYFNCDSIGIKNEVLKQYVITLDFLHQNNWTVIYE